MNVFWRVLCRVGKVARGPHTTRDCPASRWRNRLASCRVQRLEQLEERTLLSVVPPLVSEEEACTTTVGSSTVEFAEGSYSLDHLSMVRELAPRPIPMEPFASPVVDEPVESLPGVWHPVGQPTSYDLRTLGHVTSVKDQNPYGTCWAFATYGSMESNILVNGGSAEDFAERSLVFHDFDWGYDDGGNMYLSSAELTAGRDPLNESQYPYSGMPTDPGVEGTPSTIASYCREMFICDTATEIKNAIMGYGACYTTFYVGSSYFNTTKEYYYYPSMGGASPNHAVCIVGWNDDIAAANFTGAGGAPPGDGAWLIKNSWGSTYHGDGYFWMSYYDKYMLPDEMYGAFFCDAVDQPETFGTVYKHDDFGYVYGWSYSTVLNAFTPTADETLAAVNFWTLADGASYDVRIYDNFSTGAGPSTLLAQKTGTCTYWGNHTVELDNPVSLTTGDGFYVWLNIAGGGTYPQASDAYYADYSSACTANTGESYYLYSGSWRDMSVYWASHEANWCIKALTGEPGQFDYGDAPTAAQSGLAGSYPTLLVNNGARHAEGGPFLGSARDLEINGQPTLAANGDDAAGGTPDDEDGVTICTLLQGQTQSVPVVVSGATGYLDAWIDFNQDGDWADAGEKVHSAQLAVGAHDIPITVPGTATLGTTYARFRISTAGGLTPTGLAENGEVEDYEILIQPSEGPEWTFMVYLDGDNDLEEAGIDDFLEIASVASDGNVNLVVQFDRISGHDATYGNWTDTRRGIIMRGNVPDTSWGTSIGEVNMGDPATLSNFVNWAIGAYPAQRYALVLWDHGDGWRGDTSEIRKGACWDDSSGGDYLENREVGAALAAVPENIDLFGYDCCLMGMIECAHEVKDEASVFVASESLEPGDGWPYDAFLSHLASNPTWTAAQLASVIGDAEYLISYSEVIPGLASPGAVQERSREYLVGSPAVRSATASGGVISL